MRLRSLKMQGFKSFPDSTVVNFHEGITAVVGPNGCGKSNIVDAVRWVLGEQRPTAIRGARMEEAIFQGTVSRRPVGRASVSLLLANEDGALPVPFEEVEIARTVYRDGGSEYRLNRTPCRLRDIVDLCRDAGLGASGYSVIEARMIDAILSGRAEERRALFEEAAGIGKYKDRRRTALRRLEASDADLQRVETVIEEVRSKVRSLARQRGKAQRWKDLRARRLALELAVAVHRTADLKERLALVDADLRSGRGDTAAAEAQLAAAEAGLERARLQRVEAEKDRAGAAQALDKARAELARVEKETAVAAVQIEAGQRRLGQVGKELAELEDLRTRSSAEVAALREELAERKAATDAAATDLAGRRAAAEEAGGRLQEARAPMAVLEERERDLARRLAQLQGDRESARGQAAEFGRRHAELTQEAADGAAALKDLRAQGDLFAQRSVEMARKAEEAAAEADEARGTLARVRERLAEVRERQMGLESESAGLAAEAAGLRRAAEAEGDAEARAAAAALPERVHGLLSDFVGVGGAEADVRIVDDALGALGSALVIGDAEDADAVLHWYRSAPERSRGLILLPAEKAPAPPGPLPPGVAASGAGAAWAVAVLGGVRAREAPPDATEAANEGDRAYDTLAVWTDALGAIHLAPRQGAAGPLERAAHLEALESKLAQLRRDLEVAQDERSQLEEEQSLKESLSEAASERLLKVRDDARSVQADAAARADEHERVGRHQDELARRLQAARKAREQAVGRERAAGEEIDAATGEARAVAGEADGRRAELRAAEADWEAVREAQAEAEMRVARAESACERLEGRLSDATGAAERTAGRISELRGEAAAVDAEVARLAKASTEGEGELERLFGQRDEAGAALSERDRVLDEARESEAGLERQLRDVRGAERKAAERRHELELERQGLANETGRIGERLAAEWGRPLDALLAENEPAQGDAGELSAELEDVVARLARMGPVNMLAVEEHAEEKERLDFLERQRKDLAAARDDLRAAVRGVNAKATELFNTTFEAIREHFRRTFMRLFSGGEADLWLADPDDPLESPVEIQAAPQGKRTQRIDLLSGGERALTALSLLFGIYLYRPSLFCFLDEVDAPLDEANIVRFIRLLESFKSETQFVVVTHNPRTIEAADWIYGVTMEEPGVSSLVGVQLDADEGSGATAA